MKWTLDHIKKLKEEGKIVDYIDNGKVDKIGLIKNYQNEPKKSKYGNKRVEVDGEWFDSIKEANRWKVLKLLLKAGKIGLLERQVVYELNEGGTHSLKYIADFRYWDCDKNRMVTEDCKGFRTREYKRKKRLMKKIYGIEILET